MEEENEKLLDSPSRFSEAESDITCVQDEKVPSRYSSLGTKFNWLFLLLLIATNVGCISLVTIRWQASQKLPVADFTAPHECVNFDSLNDWARERRINAMEPGLLVHPTLGMES